ncbi:MAG TPA: D-aminoacylase [Spirochaetia bacterium]|nr:D-aminoacylase [Spirochaetia bacterium]
MRYDVIIRNAKIIDGTGNPWFSGEIGIKDGRILSLGRKIPHEAIESVDAGGMMVCPGFIDAHTHSDFVFFIDPSAQSKVRQGVTTEVTGNCGMSGSPLSGAARYMAAHLARDFSPSWTTVQEYLTLLSRQPKTTNLAPLIGHMNLRAGMLGMDDRQPKPKELDEMKGMLADGLDAGAFGFSMGLYFAPGNYAKKDEIVAMVATAGEHDLVTTAHIRDEGVRTVGFVPAVREFIEAGREAAAPIHISHLKAFGPDVWGASTEVLDIIDGARAEGIDVTCDQYPYTASGGLMAADVIPTSFVKGKSPEEVSGMMKEEKYRSQVIERVGINIRKRGGADRLTIANYPFDHSLEGKTLQQIADERGKDTAEVLLDMISDYYDGSWTCESMSREDVDRIIRYPFTMVGSDGSSISTEGPLSSGNPHPRNFGAFPRVLSEFVRDRSVLRLEEAVRKMTSLPAKRFSILHRGMLEEGYWADIVLFDLGSIKDAGFENPKQYPSGIPYVMVNGEWVIKKDEFTGALPGRLARRR